MRRDRSTARTAADKLKFNTKTMLTIIKGLPAHVLGVRASGEVSADDIAQVLRPALDEQAARAGGINYLLVLDTEVQAFTAGAWWQDMLAGLQHFTNWQRIAVVTDQKPVELFTDLFELGVPGRSKGFASHELAQATAWIGRREPRSSARTIGRIALGAMLLTAGISHLTFARKAFRAQVPDRLPLDKDTTVVYSGFAEIALGSALILTPQKYEARVGQVAAGFFTAVFPGNISQYSHDRSAFGLDTKGKRFARLFFQPLLVLWALKSTTN